uniref:Uncharacterized protein n=1 Tax=Rhizophora mucronata TaxID=61149 RepID=A0A2P2Q836_RHIMU
MCSQGWSISKETNSIADTMSVATCYL